MDSQLLKSLQALCGRRLNYTGHDCTVIDVLDGENALVLRCEDSQRSIQANQFGEANRRVRECRSLAVFDEHSEINPVIKTWLDQLP